MLQGTGSDVGKSVLVAGLCRWASNQGLSVAPFKPQNMSNNAAVADIPLSDGSGGEIGRAQQTQAIAARVASSVDMNPVLLKPQSETGSQIIVHGKVWGTARGRDYQRLKPQLLSAVLESFKRLSAAHDLVIVEGAGSPAEINLRKGDIANMGFATAANVPVVLVGDIDRGGVIASLVGTHTILPKQDRDQIAGFLINKFRGDVSLFDDGLQQITAFTGWKSFGVVPWLADAVRLPAEDSVALEQQARAPNGHPIIVVPVLSRISNFDDLDPLVQMGDLDVRFLRPHEPWPENAALVVLPGSKSTIADLIEFKALGWDEMLTRHVAAGGSVIGLCGGYQMLGRSVRDPDRIEGTVAQCDGLGLLDVETVLAGRKRVVNSIARDAKSGEELSGYEIHMGRTQGPDTSRPMLRIDGQADGAMSPDGKVRGCYLHGIFANDAWRHQFLAAIGIESKPIRYRQNVDAALDAIAEQLQACIDPALFELKPG